jgi:hypothetical protein
LQVVKPVPILGKGVVLHDASEFTPVLFDDGKITPVPKFGAVDRFSIPHVLGDLGFKFLDRQSELYPTRHGFPFGREIVDSDVISEEPGPFGPGMCDQCLLRGQFQFEAISEELFQLDFDLLGLFLRAGEAQEEIVGISDVPKPSIVRIFLVSVPDPSGLFLEGLQRGLICPIVSEFLDSGNEPVIVLASPPDLSTGIPRDEGRFDESIKPSHIDIREQWADDSALWCPAQRRSVVPFFEVSGFEQVLNQDQEAVVVDLLAED